MKRLAFDTSFAACSVALTGLDQPSIDPPATDARANHASPTGTISCFEEMHTGQAVRLMPMIQQVMTQADQNFDDLDGIFTTDGPGTFTGVRIAVAAARALALSTGLPVYTSTSLALIARKAEFMLAQERDGRTIAVCVDARRDEIYFQLFTDTSKLPLTHPQVLSSDNAVRLCENKPMIAVGTGAQKFANAANEFGLRVTAKLETLQPDVGYSSGIYEQRQQPLVPLYLRPPDAKPQFGKSIPRVP